MPLREGPVAVCILQGLVHQTAKVFLDRVGKVIDDLSLIGIQHKRMQVGEVFRSEDRRHGGEVVAGEIEVLQILQGCEFFRQGDQTVGADVEPPESCQSADVRPRIQTLEEGVGIAEEGEFLAGGQILDLERDAFISGEEHEAGAAYPALVGTGFPDRDSFPMLHLLGDFVVGETAQGASDGQKGKGIALHSGLDGFRSFLTDHQAVVPYGFLAFFQRNEADRGCPGCLVVIEVPFETESDLPRPGSPVELEFCHPATEPGGILLGDLDPERQIGHHINLEGPFAEWGVALEGDLRTEGVDGIFETLLGHSDVPALAGACLFEPDKAFPRGKRQGRVDADGADSAAVAVGR